MTATDKLRRMLDERGVKWWCGEDERKTYWRSNGLTWEYFNDENGDAWLGFLGACENDVTPAQAIAATLGPVITGDTSDGYHTFNELYHHRAVLFSVIVRDHANLAWKSRVHHDGTMYDGMFIVGIETPQGQATYHYEIGPYWDMFKCKELDRAPEWDGHTPDDAIARIATLGDVDATRERHGDAGTCRKVYLVEVSDELLESWFPFAVFLHRESADDYAEALRGKDDGVLCFARVGELKVVDE